MGGQMRRKLLSKRPSLSATGFYSPQSHLHVFRWGDWSDYVDNANDLKAFGTDLPDLYQPNPDLPM